MTKMNAKSLATLSIVALLSLSACKTTEQSILKPIDSMRGEHAETEARLSTAAAHAIAAGKTDEALKHYTELYLKDSGDRDTVINYAQLLRKTGNAKRAAEILSPYIKDYQGGDQKKQKPSPLFLNEYAAALIELGKLPEAEKTLDRVLEDETAKDFHADAHNLMGISLDARGEHHEAEGMFRLATDEWKGNPTSVMNNLALCLANQGMFDQSLETLRRALVMAPDKQEIARNIQIVSDLRTSIVPKAPVNLKKEKPKKK